MKRWILFQSMTKLFRRKINESGYITNIEIVKSTEDQLLDDKIISIVGNWKFEVGTSLQKAMLKLKYFIK